MKYIVILYWCAVLLLVPYAAGAARTTGGVVPSTVPLFPTPVGVEANLKGNIHHEGTSVFTDPAETEQGPAGEPGTAAVPDQGVKATGAGEAAGGTALKGWGAVAGILLVVVLVAGAVWAARRKRM